MFKQIVKALAFVHNKEMAHRDLKADNIIYDHKTGKVKLIDFGFACSAKEKLKVFCGTPSYMSPEIVGKHEYFGQAVDIWASGVTLFYMLVGVMPFKATNERELFKRIQKGHFTVPTRVALSEEVKDLMKQLLCID
jgi:serine/threonine protein kinase